MTKQAQADEIHASTVSDQPGRPVAAPCTISGCHYAEMDRAQARARMLHDATCFTDSGALRARVHELERELAEPPVVVRYQRDIERIEELGRDLAHETHEKETVADAGAAYQKWAHGRIEELEREVARLKEEVDNTLIEMAACADTWEIHGLPVADTGWVIKRMREWISRGLLTRS